MTTPEEEAAAAAAAIEAAKEVDKPLSKQELLEELEKRLEVRDRAILESMQNIANSVRENKQVEPKKEEPTKDLDITADDFYRDPVRAMSAFYQAKVAPLVEKAQKTSEPDPNAVIARIEVEEMKLRDRVGVEAFAKYKPYYDKVKAQADPRVLAEAAGIDAVWRLTRSYADDMITQQDNERSERIRKIQLKQQRDSCIIKPAKVELSEDERAVAERMGISPELWKQYDHAEEIEIGSNRKEKK